MTDQKLVYSDAILMKRRFMSNEELDQKLSNLDERWTSEGLPLKLRLLESFQEIYGSVQDNQGRHLLFAPIIAWYAKRYGAKSIDWDGILGHIPIEYQGSIYLVDVPQTFELVSIPLVTRIVGFTEEQRASFTRDDFKEFAPMVTTMTMAWQSITELQADSIFLGLSNRSLLRRAIFDLQEAATGLARSGDTQRAVFDAHAAAEKFLKIAFQMSGSSRNPRNFGHNGRKLFRELIALEKRYAWLNKSIDYLSDLVPTMAIRYETVCLTLSQAVKAVHASLFLCGALASMWNFDNLRGSSNSRFIAARFYINSRRSKFFCKRVTSSHATLTYFELNKYTGGQMADIVMPIANSALYLEVTDWIELRDFRQQFALQLRNPGRLVTPEDIGLITTNGPQGVYTTSLISTDIEV